MPLKDFLNEKLTNFERFINDQLVILDKEGIVIEEIKISALRKELELLKNNTVIFVQQISFLEDKETDDAVKLFLLKYDIDIAIIKPYIDYSKLKKYIEMFIDIIRNL
jgi:septum formation inhibitor MinC